MSSRNQHFVVQQRLRDMILQGELASGERLTQSALAERLGISRQPIRELLPALAKEGLLIACGARSFQVRTFAAKECVEAIRLRAALEGIAARMIAERGAEPELLARFDACLAELDAVFAKGAVVESDEATYGEVNQRFHGLLLEGSGSSLLPELVARCNVIPFVSPGTIAFDRSDLGNVYSLLSYAQRQHHAIVDAIRTGNAMRAEFLLREHAQTQEQSMSFRQDPAEPRSGVNARPSPVKKTRAGAAARQR